ncbi:MAG: hypothetical protein KGL23_01760 [Acidobacteriota bacterium]|nr:hypothetical protein [Acidobacteriota bacterium]MDE3146144.1 hypothetical protein [Acidobacteriota bacterium]
MPVVRRVLEALAVVLAVAVVARVVLGLLGPLIPGIALATIVALFAAAILRGPRAKS